MSVIVDLALEKDAKDWDEFVSRQTSNHHAHCWNWKHIISSTFLHQPYYLIARTNLNETHSSGHIVGVLPLMYVKSFLFGKALISLPYLNGGGILASSEEALMALQSKAMELANDISADYLELRHRSAVHSLQTNFNERSHKIAVTLPLNSSPEELFKSFPAKLRSQIRRPSKSGVYAQVLSKTLNETVFLEDFYSVFSHNMRDLGTPVYPRKLFRNTKKYFGKNCRIIVIKHSNKAIAAAITVGHGQHVEIPWASSIKKYNALSPNMLLYWEAIKTACEDGYKTFDFGRSSLDSGTLRFKKQWGGTPLPLYWYSSLRYGNAAPEVNPNSAKFSTLVKCWKTLPLPLANTMGPWLTRSIP